MMSDTVDTAVRIRISGLPAVHDWTPDGTRRALSFDPTVGRTGCGVRVARGRARPTTEATTCPTCARNGER